MYCVLSTLLHYSFATVWKARRRRDGVTVALKKVNCANMDEANQAIQVGTVNRGLIAASLCASYICDDVVPFWRVFCDDGIDPNDFCGVRRDSCY